MMKKLGWILLIAGTIVGSLGGARLPEADWTIAGVGLAMLAGSAVLMRLAARHAGGGAAAAGSDVVAAMRQLTERLEALVKEAPSLSLAEVAERISRLSADFFAPISDGSPRMLGAMGPERYAEVFGTYASGERSIARAWSAASDQHRPETLASLELGTARIKEAVSRLEG